MHKFYILSYSKGNVLYTYYLATCFSSINKNPGNHSTFSAEIDLDTVLKKWGNFDYNSIGATEYVLSTLCGEMSLRSEGGLFK